MAGYSGTPLATKLGIKAGHTVVVVGGPAGFLDSLAPLPPVKLGTTVRGICDVIVLFVTRRSELERRLDGIVAHLEPAGGFWVAWPKKSSGVVTDMTEDVIRDVALPRGLVDNKVCAIDETWSGLRLVIRKALRPRRATRSRATRRARRERVTNRAMSPRLVIAGSVLALFLVGCGDSSGLCGEVYDNSKSCWVEEAKKRIEDGEGDEDLEKIPTRSEFIQLCKASMRTEKDEIEAMSRCAKEPTCEEKDACEDKERDARWAKKQVKEVDKAVAKGDWQKGFEECRYLRDEPDPALLAACEKVYAEGMPALMTSGKADDVKSACSYSEDLKKKAPAFAKACVDVMSVELEAKKKAAIAARDAGADDNYLQCSELRTVAESVGEQAKKDAETLCTEMTIASSAKQAINEAKASTAARRSEVSYYCTSALDSIAALEPKTDWSTKTQDEVIKHCYLDAGKVIVEIELASEYPYCSYSLTQVRDAIPKYGLAGKDPEFDDAIAKTDKLCIR